MDIQSCFIEVKKNETQDETMIRLLFDWTLLTISIKQYIKPLLLARVFVNDSNSRVDE